MHQSVTTKSTQSKVFAKSLIKHPFPESESKINFLPITLNSLNAKSKDSLKAETDGVALKSSRRNKKNQKKLRKESGFNSGKWTPLEKQRFEEFCQREESNKKISKYRRKYFFRDMSEYIRTRSPSQCRSHEQKINKRNGTGPKVKSKRVHIEDYDLSTSSPSNFVSSPEIDDSYQHFIPINCSLTDSLSELFVNDPNSILDFHKNTSSLTSNLSIEAKQPVHKIYNLDDEDSLPEKVKNSKRKFFEIFSQSENA